MADDHLQLHNQAVRAAAEELVTRLDATASDRRGAAGSAPLADPLAALTTRFADALRSTAATTDAAADIDADADLAMQVDLVARGQFGADLALKFPGLLRRGGPKAFTAQHADWIVETLAGGQFADAVADVAAVGMYVNLTLTDSWLLAAVDAIVGAGDEFGRSNELAAERVVVDYSSPNVAKTLHAGHIRSTIIGQVLSNLIDAAGGVAFRVNHINDFGGFGFLLEGTRRFEPTFDPALSTNERAIEVYRLRRALERGAAGDEPSADERALIARHLPGATSAPAIADAFKELTAASDARFERLESGDPDEVACWRTLVDASLADFAAFYDSLGVDIDFVLGESFYAQDGIRLVREWVDEGGAVVYDDAEAATDLAAIDEALAAGELSEAEADTARAGVDKDRGAIVVRLSAVERFVILRSDGRSVYATRDLAAIKVRGELFDPTACLYVVGQEQQAHFSRLFASAYRLGIADPQHTTFEHVSFGFYIDPTTKKKLSSRESVAGVAALFDTANAYFLSRRSDRIDDPEFVAHQLTVASTVFNDLKADLKSSVELDVDDPASLLDMFEKSGGAYVIYAACRAGAVVRKAAEQTTPTISAVGSLDADEVALILELLTTPRRVVNAARHRDPSGLVRHLLDISNHYNSWYTRSRVITDDGVLGERLRITAAAEQTLRNGLRWCNVDCPEAI